MIGWHISIYKQADDALLPATFETPQGPRLAVWQTGGDGLNWIDEAVKAKKAIDLGGDGYPCRYTATAEFLTPYLGKPPEANLVWISDPGDILGEGWEGKTVIDQEAVGICLPGEWLLIDAWDES